MSAGDAYYTLTSLFSYLLAVCFGTFLALGILLLHIRGPPKTKTVSTSNHHSLPDQAPTMPQSWRELTKDVINPIMSIACAIIYLIGSLYPIIASWIPPQKGKSPSVRWYTVPLASICILLFSTVWFLGFLAITAHRKRSGREEFIYICEPEFGYANSPAADPGHYGRDPEQYGDALRRRGGLVLIREIIYKTWKGNEMNDIHGARSNNKNNQDNYGHHYNDYTNNNTVQMRAYRMQPADRQS